MGWDQKNGVEHISFAEIIFLNKNWRATQQGKSTQSNFAKHVFLLVGEGMDIKTGPLSLTGPDLSSHEFLQGFHRIPSRDLLMVPNFPISSDQTPLGSRWWFNPMKTGTPLWSGVIKLPFLRGSNNTNLWWFWGIALITMHWLTTRKRYQKSNLNKRCVDLRGTLAGHQLSVNWWFGLLGDLKYRRSMNTKNNLGSIQF